MTDKQIDELLQSQTMELLVLLSVIFKVTHQAMEKRLAQHASELSRLQFSIMMIVAHAGSQTISELSRKIGVDPSTLVPSVDAMERKKLIIRQRDPNDRRRIPLSLTETGKSLIDQIGVMGDDDPILLGVQEMEDVDLHRLLILLCELIGHLPESENMLEHAKSRLSAYGAKEEYLICKQQDK